MRVLASAFLLVSSLVLFSACANDEDEPTPVTPAGPLEIKVVNNLDADTSRRDPATGQTFGTGRFTLYSLSTGQRINNADSATNRWDVGFRGTTIIVNGGTSGPGQGGAAVIDGVFEDVNNFALEGSSFTASNATIVSGFKTDGEGTPPFAIPNTSGNGWYNYDAPNNVIRTIPGRVFAIRTAEGKWAKLEIISYYFGAPANPTFTDRARWYNFRYTFQADGTGVVK